MKIERKEKEFTPIVLTIETREELDHLFAAIWSVYEDEFEDCKEATGIKSNYNSDLDIEIMALLKDLL